MHERHCGGVSPVFLPEGEGGLQQLQEESFGIACEQATTIRTEEAGHLSHVRHMNDAGL
jgi:hypothetical protein